MDSLYAQLLLKIYDRMGNAVPEIKYIGQDFSQLEAYDIRPAVAFPCCLIDFIGTNYDQMQNNRQWGNAAFQLKLGLDNFSSDTNFSPDAVKEKALLYYDIEYKIYKAFQGWDADGLIQPITRINDAKEPREDLLRVRIITFNTTFEDDGAVPVFDKSQRPGVQFENDNS